jgi:aminopeptidase YwaD
MFNRALLILAVAALLPPAPTQGQVTPWYQWTLLPAEVMDEIIGESSGETAWNSISAMGGFNRDRLAAEYEGTFFEAEYILDELIRHGLPGAEIVRFPGGSVWDGIKGELWEVSPLRRKLASYQDLRAMLANGSTDADVTAELVWVGSGTDAEVEAAGVAGKIAVTDGSIGGAARLACRERGALGVVAIGNSRPHFDPLQIPWSGVGSRGAPAGSGCFGFFIPPREAETLKTRLLRGETITVHAQVEATMRSYEMPDPVAYIPGTDPEAPEIILSAHLFEGYVKQGANDNLSGSAALLEVARTLHTLIEDGRIPRPRRTIRFLWGPEYSGTGPWVVANKELMERTLANINLDMVGEWLSLNKGFMTLVRTTYGGPHFINDVMENYYRFVGEGNRERIQNRRDFPLVPRRIVAPSGADEPFYYSIETHYGSSDHMVFNDWGVQVPGIMMIAWPDQWYHTSGDRPDKSDPTQLKRVVIIAAAGAYTVAAADDAMAMRLAGEIASNGTRRLGHQFVMGLERLNHATGPDLNQSYRWARAHVEAGLANESATLATVLQLADDGEAVGAHMAVMDQTLRSVAQAHLTALDAHMAVVAAGLGVSPASLALSEMEVRAESSVPRPTALVKRDGYRGWQRHLQAVPEAELADLPFDGVANTGELRLLIDGTRSVLDIKKALDAQSRDTSDLQAIFNYIEVLRRAGLVEM